MIPPSNALITYSLVYRRHLCGSPVSCRLHSGILWAVCCVVVSVIIAKKKGYREPGQIRLEEPGRSHIESYPFSVPDCGGYRRHHHRRVHRTEGSAIAVVYALILGICYRNITLKSFWKILVESAKMSGMVVFLIGVSNILGWVMAFTQIPQAISAALLGITNSPVVILLIMNVILIDIRIVIAGTFMDVTPAIMIFTPLFLPVVQTFGMDPIHFGLILVYNLCIGNITPPVGNTLFVAIKVGKTTLAKVMPYMLMYYVSIIVGLLLVTYVPAVSMALPMWAGLA